MERISKRTTSTSTARNASTRIATTMRITANPAARKLGAERIYERTTSTSTTTNASTRIATTMRITARAATRKLGAKRIANPATSTSKTRCVRAQIATNMRSTASKADGRSFVQSIVIATSTSTSITKGVSSARCRRINTRIPILSSVNASNATRPSLGRA